MRLIGAGFPRTGTMSTKAALEMLGLGPCYHFVTQFERPQDAPVWLAAAQGKPVDWTGLLGDFPSAVDWPQSAFYRELMEVYPEARVLLTLRSPESWYESMATTVYPVAQAGLTAPPGHPMRLPTEVTDVLGWQGIFRGRFSDKTYALQVYEEWNRGVQDYVPADRLLVWQVSQGWGPLCAFLGLPVPDAPFPHLNDAASFKQRFMP